MICVYAMFFVFCFLMPSHVGNTIVGILSFHEHFTPEIMWSMQTSVNIMFLVNHTKSGFDL